MTRRSLFLLVVGLFVASLALAACSDNDDPAPPAEQPGEQQADPEDQAAPEDPAEEQVAPEFAGTIKIGLIVDLQGPIAIGTLAAAEPGIEAAVRDINAAGGLVVGDSRYQLEAVIVDGRSDRVAAVAAAQEMLADGEILAIAVTTLNFPAVYEQLRDEDVIVLTHDSNATNLLGTEGPAEHPRLFGTVTEIGTTVDGWTNFIHAALPEVQSFGMLLPDVPAVGPIIPAFEASTAALGLEFAGTELIPPGTTDLSVFITRLKAQSPDIVNIALSLGQLKQYIDLDLAPFVITSFQPRDLDQIELGDTTAVFLGTREPYTQEIAPPALRAVLTEKFGDFDQLLGLAMAYYDTTYLLAQAIEAAGSIEDVGAIAALVSGQSFDGPFGTTTMQDNHTALSGGALIAATQTEFTIFTFDSQKDSTVNETVVIPR
jgi:ABC-type branched-subunit amino acid transport system substrate-binding protein